MGLPFGSGVWDEVIDQGWEGQYVSCRMISSSDSDVREGKKRGQREGDILDFR